MNERIREFYREATGKDWAYDFDPQVAERFAQFIVRECAQFVEDKFDFLGDEILVKEKMLEHFGVEE